MADTHYYAIAKIGVLEGILAKMQVGSSPPTLVVYNGTRGNIGASTALVAFILADPAGVIDEGDLTLELVPSTASSMVTASGVPQWAMLFDGNAQPFNNFDAGGSDSTAAVKVSVLDGEPLFAGGLVTLTSALYQI